MLSFLSQLAEYIVSKHEQNLENILIVLPNKRSGLFFKNELAKLINKTLWLPQITDAENFIAKLSDSILVDNLTLLLELYHTYLELNSEKQEPLDEFISRGQILLQDFNEIDRYLLNPDDFFKAINEVRALETWNIGGDDLTEVEKNYIRFWEEMGTIYKSFRQRLQTKNIAYQGMAFRTVAENLNSAAIADKINEYECIYFSGFNALTKAEEEIISHFVKENKAQVFWDCDKYYMDDELQEAGIFLRRYAKKQQFTKSFKPENNLSESPKKIEICAISQNIAQVKWAAGIIENIAKTTENLTNTAVVLADETLLVPLLQSLPENVNKVNITMGLPLKQSPLFAFFQSLLRLHRNFEKFNRKGFYHKDIYAVLNNRFSEILTNYDAVNGLKKYLQRYNVIFFFPESHSDDIQIDKSLLSLFEITASVDDLIDKLNRVVSDFKSALLLNPEKYGFELEELYNISKILNIINKYQSNYKAFNTIESLNYFFNQLSKNLKLDFYGEPLSGLQILGLLETRNIDFENVILLGVNEGKLPAGKIVNSFITNDIKHHFKLPTYIEKDAVYAYHFYRLLQRANDIYISYDTDDSDFNKGEMSHYLTQLIYEYRYKNPKVEINQYSLASNVTHIEQKETEISKNEAVLNGINEYFTHISPSSLINYLDCPLDFYFKYVLKIRESDEVEEELDAGEFGTIVHEVLQKIYEPFVKKMLDPEKLFLEKKKVRGYCSAAYQKIYHSSQKRLGKNFLAFEVILKYINDFIEADIKRIKLINSPITIESLEEEWFADFTVEINNEKQIFNLKGKIDRIERQGNLTTIIDYKTGLVEKKDVTLKADAVLYEKPKALQLLFYAYLLENNKNNIPFDNINAGNYSLRNLTAGLITVNENFISEENLFSFENTLTAIITEMLNTEISFKHNEESKYCKMCI